MLRPARVLVQCCALLAALGVTAGCSIGTVRQANAPAPRERVDRYLSALEQRDVPTAYDVLCPGKQHRESLPAFRERVTATAADAGGPPRSHTFQKSDVLSNNLAVVKYTERTSTSEVRRTVTLDHNGSEWCISSIH